MEKYRVSNDRSDFPMGGQSLVRVDLVRGLFT